MSYSELERGHFFITTDFVGHIARTAGAGAAPLNNIFLDNIYRLIGIVRITTGLSLFCLWLTMVLIQIGLPIFRMDVDKQVRQAPEAVAYKRSLAQASTRP